MNIRHFVTSCRAYMLILAGLLTVLFGGSATANQRVYGWCVQGGMSVTIQGMSGYQTTPKVQGSFPSCTVTVYLTGTTTLATLYSDNNNTAMSNPFTADTTGFYYFYAANGRYDINVGGSSLSARTYGDALAQDMGGANGIGSANFQASGPNVGGGTVSRPVDQKLDEVVSVKDFGAVGDGVTDDTAAMKLALRSSDAYYNTEFSNKNGRHILVPPGSYLISSPLYLRKGDVLECAGGTASNIQTTSAFASGAMLYMGFKSDGTPDPGGLVPAVRGCFFSSSSSNIVVGVQSYIGSSYVSGFIIEDNWFTVNTGISVKGTDGLIRHNMFDNSITGIDVVGDGTRYGITHDIMIDDNTFYSPSYACIQIDGANDVTVLGGYCSYAKFRGVYFLNTVSGGTSYRVKVQGVMFTTSASSGNYDASQTDIDIEWPLEDSQFTGNHFSRSRRASVYMNNAATVNTVFANNQYQDTNDTAVIISSSGAGTNFNNESFRNVGNYAIDNNGGGPITVTNAYCTGLFAVAGLPVNNYDQACFRLQQPNVNGSFLSHNRTDSSTYGVVAVRSSATGVNTDTNQSRWTYDVFWYGSSSQTGSTANERTANAGGVLLYAYGTRATPVIQYVTDFGAKMDGVTDDSAALQACVNTGMCNVPSGTLTFLTTIYMPVTSLGSSRLFCSAHGTNLKYTGSGDALAVLSSAGGNNIGLDIENCTITGTVSGKSGIHVRGFQGGTINNVTINNFSGGDGFLNDGANSILVTNLIAAGNINGIHEKGTNIGGLGYSANAMRFIGGVVENNSKWGVFEDASGTSVTTANQSNVYELVFETNGTANTPSGQAYFEGCDACELRNSYVEAARPNTGIPYSIVVGGTASDGIGDIAYRNNKMIIKHNFLGTVSTPSITLVQGLGTTIEDNWEAGTPTYFVDQGTGISAGTTVLRNEVLSVSSAFFNGTDTTASLIEDLSGGTQENSVHTTQYGSGFTEIASAVSNQEVRLRANGGSLIAAFRNIGGSTVASVNVSGQLTFGGFVGVPLDSPGMKHKTLTSCTTPASQFGTCNTVWTFSTAFADVGYTAVCNSGGNVNGPVTVIDQPTRTTTALTITIANYGSNAAASSTTLDCAAWHP